MAHDTPSTESTIFNYYRSTVLRKMPPEIMTNIFQAFIDLDRPRAALHCATELASVCKTWYNIVMTSPSLWTNIYVFNRMVFAKGAHLVVKEWIQRSKALPINLFIPGTWHDSRDFDYLFHNGSREVLSNMVQLVTVLAESSHRWRAISFHISFHFIRRFCDMAQDLSQLRSVKYSHKCREWAGSLQWKRPLSLETVKIRFKLTSSLLQTLNVRSDSLTRLSVKDMSVERCMDTIRGSPVLRYFKTGLTDAVPIEDFVPPPPVVHEVLESLALLFAMDPNLLDRLLPLLTLPALHTLDLDLVGNQDPHIVQDFLRRSSAPITSMKLMYEQECHSRNLPSFQAITAHTPSLTHLHLYYGDISEKDNAEYVDTTILKYLVETGRPRHDDPSYTPPLPQLQSLTCTSPRVNMPKLIPCDILPGLFPFSTPGSGEPSLRPIKSLITSESCWPGEPYLRALLPLRQAGIDFGHRNTTLDSMAALA